MLERTAQEGARGHDLCRQEDVAQPLHPFHSDFMAVLLRWEQAASSDRARVVSGSPLRLFGGTVTYVPRQQVGGSFDGNSHFLQRPSQAGPGSGVDSFLLGMWAVMTRGLPETTQPAQF